MPARKSEAAKNECDLNITLEFSENKSEAWNFTLHKDEIEKEFTSDRFPNLTVDVNRYSLADQEETKVMITVYETGRVSSVDLNASQDDATADKCLSMFQFLFKPEERKKKYDFLDSNKNLINVKLSKNT